MGYSVWRVEEDQFGWSALVSKDDEHFYWVDAVVDESGEFSASWNELVLGKHEDFKTEAEVENFSFPEDFDEAKKVVLNYLIELGKIKQLDNNRYKRKIQIGWIKEVI